LCDEYDIPSSQTQPTEVSLNTNESEPIIIKIQPDEDSPKTEQKSKLKRTYKKRQDGNSKIESAPINETTKPLKKKMNGKPIFISTVRGDVVIKTILRVMRKTYLNLFNEMTSYSTRIRHKPLNYLRECVEQFISETKIFEDKSKDQSRK
jgi:hypothetical protein